MFNIFVLFIAEANFFLCLNFVVKNPRFEFDRFLINLLVVQDEMLSVNEVLNI